MAIEKIEIEEIDILWTIKELYPQIEENNKTDLTSLVTQIISNIHVYNPNSLKMSHETIKICIKTTVNKALEVLENK